MKQNKSELGNLAVPGGDREILTHTALSAGRNATTFARWLSTVTSFPAQLDLKEHTWTLQDASLLQDGGTAFSPGALLMILSPDVIQTHRPTGRGEEEEPGYPTAQT